MTEIQRARFRSQLDEQPPFSPEEVAALAEAAGLAPSVLNTQPWAIRAVADGMDVFQDPVRDLPHIDPAGRERMISCGAAVFNVEVAMRRLGWTVHTELLPVPAMTGLVARIRRGARQRAGEVDLRMYAAMRQRRTYRQVFGPGTVPPRLLEAIEVVAAAHSCRLHVVADTYERQRIAELMVGAATMQATDPDFQAELGNWMRQRGDDAGLTSASVGHAPYPYDGIVHRPTLGGVDARQVEDALARSTVAILTTREDRPMDWLRAGMALQQILLTVTHHGLVVGLSEQVIEVPRTRAELATRLSTVDHPQMLLRIGHPLLNMPPTGRRSLADLFVADTPGQAR
ncbi:Acg family FMN-binding oxidoreductase [Fodinicola acaciae]|uniref:Acg family FMN-binding oxidoreductase n=1 Tax=Fodinicola acaciae TaxID=2681555 RepID=UPI0013D2CF99|nr:hypothetical protein [Fodinicola acaciae]